MAFTRDRHPEPQATSLIDLWAEWDDDPDFQTFRAEGTRLVPGFGASRPIAMVVGDYPGAVDTTQRRPFSGANGTVLRDLMEVAGLHAEDGTSTPWDVEQGEPERIGYANAWVTYTFKYRIPGKPTVWHSFRAQPYLRREWALIGRPKVLVTVGALAWETLGRVELGGIQRNAGQPIMMRGGAVLWPMLHPAYGLANEEEQPRMERHWEHMGDWLSREGYL